MAGGFGKRFWPIGRRSRPKQLLPIGGGRPLLEDTLARIAALIPPERQWLAIGRDVEAPIRRLLGSKPAQTMLVEPMGRNTAPCVAWAALKIQRRQPDGILAVMPADQRFRREAVYRRALERALAVADRRKKIVIFGLTATRVETGYGYIEREPEGWDPKRGGAVRRFVEKPDDAAAQRLIDEGCLWNSGHFVFRADVFIEQLKQTAPEIILPLLEIAECMDTPKEADALAEAFSDLPALSVDHALLERSREIWCLPLADAGWIDFGSWSAVYDALPKDRDANASEGIVVTHDARGNLIVNETDQAVALVGVENQMILVTRDAILVGPKSRDQDIKSLVDQLARRGLTRLE